MGRHGLRLSTVMAIYHVPLSDGCSGVNCASACNGESCGSALPSVVRRLRLRVASNNVISSSSTASSCKWLCRHKLWHAADGALLTGFTTGARAMVCERLTIHMCRLGLRLSAVVVFAMSFFQMDASAAIARRSATV
jgi:hypothetical protein